MAFRLIFVAAFTAAVVIAARTARRAATRHGGSINQLAAEVRWLIALRAVLGIAFYISLGAWLFRPHAFAWSFLPIPPAVRWIAAALLIPVLAFFAWSFRSIGTNYRGGVGLYEEHELVTGGAYRVLRHPIYAAFIAIMLLVLLLSANWLLGLSGLLLVASIAAVRIPIEERQLRDRFGPAWDDYCRRTGPFWPHVSRD